jgi:hypothetical protein
MSMRETVSRSKLRVFCYRSVQARWGSLDSFVELAIGLLVCGAVSLRSSSSSPEQERQEGA